MVAIPKPKRERNEDRLEFVRQMPCLLTSVGDAPFDSYFEHLQVCGSPRAGIRTPESQQRSEAHHVRQGMWSGVGTKPSDFRTVPLCTIAHKEYHEIGHRAFCEKYGIALEPQISRINAEYARAFKPRPSRALNPKASCLKGITVVCECGDTHSIPARKVSRFGAGLRYRCIRRNEVYSVSVA